MKVLIIDDSSATRFMLSKMMTELGFESKTSDDGKQALDALQKDSGFDLILVDWNMPVMNGLEFVQAARKCDQYSGIKMMMVTTETEMNNVVQALESGANEYVMKPFTKEILAEKIRLMGFEF